MHKHCVSYVCSEFFPDKKRREAILTVSYPSDTAFSLKASAGAQLNQLISKSYSCPAVIWQKEHPSRSEVLLAYPKDNIKLLAHNLYMYTQSISLPLRPDFSLSSSQAL